MRAAGVTSTLPLVPLVLLLVPLASAATITFQPPAVVAADELAVHSTSAILVFRPEDEWQADIVDADVQRTVRHRFAEANVTATNLFRYDAQPHLSETEDTTDWNQLALGPMPGAWASLVVRAKNIEIVAQDVEATASTIHGDWSTHWTDAEEADEIRIGSEVSKIREPLVVLHDRRPIALHAIGLESLEWHGATPSCPAGQNCPEPPQEGYVVEFVHHVLAGGSLTLAGAPVMAATIGRNVLSFNGTARLPLAAGTIDCTNCTLDEDALTVHGAIQLTLEGVHDGQNPTLQADLAGTYDARINEAVHPGTNAATTAALVAATAGLVVVWRILAALVSKRILSAPLDNPVRRNLHLTLEANPGATLSELRRTTGLGAGNLRHHLRVLEQAGSIRHWRDGRRTHYALTETPTVQAMQQRALEDEALGRLLGHLDHDEGRIQLDVTQWAQQSLGWARSTTQAKLRQLCNLGLVEVRTEGFRRIYSAIKPDSWQPPSRHVHR